MPNRLGTATSPYLLQHADNPVDWYPWGDEAFAAARIRDVPILLSVGYASCHWCHVMAHESFEDAATAGLMNDWFVNVKVDREERPDVDRIYMDAVQSMTGRGGWPMTAFLTPEGKPFFAGTYFPPTDRHGLPSFSRVLAAIHDAWTARRAEILVQAERLSSALDVSIVPDRDLPDWDALRAAIDGIAAGYDPEHGGFGGAPKFPQTPTLEFLFRAAATGFAPDALGLLIGSLRGMAQGGIHDLIGGGFARYSVDERWLVPHFEKMLYDNALLAGLFARTASLTGDGSLAEVARTTFDYLLRDLALPEGGFASGEDADSDGAEGTFYVFSDAEVRSAAGKAADAVTAVLGVTPQGNFEGHNVLHMAADVEEVSERFDMDPGALQAALASTLERLDDLRSRRNRPARDDKLVTAWNGLAIRALVEGSIALSEPRYREAAATTARFVLDHLRDETGRLHRSWRRGHLGPEGFCDDYAALALGCFALYAATGDTTWFTEASRLVDEMVTLFADEDGGGFWATGHDAEALITRPKNLFDNPSPSDNSLAAEALLHMAAYTGDAQWHERLADVLRLGGGMMRRHPAAVGHLLGVALTVALGTTEIAIVGPDREALMAVVHERPRPTVFLAAGEGTDDHPVPLLRHRPVLEGRTTAYACRGFVCELPTNDAESLRASLK